MIVIYNAHLENDNISRFVSQFLKILIFGVVSGQHAKNGPKWQKILPVVPYISGTIYHMIFIYGTHV